jgi:hypothetical protein
VPQVEGQRLRGDVFGGHDQIAFVLPVLVVDDDHRSAAPDVLDRGLHGVQAGRPVAVDLAGDGEGHRLSFRDFPMACRSECERPAFTIGVRR